MGRIVDPDVREDGGPEPEIEPPVESGSAPAPEPVKAPEHHPVRERLLAKARAAREARENRAVRDGLAELEAAPETPGTPRDLELDLVGARPGREPSAPVIQPGRPQLSPAMTAVFGTLLGVATVAFLIALMMRIAPRDAPRVMLPVDGPAPVPAGSVAAAPQPTPPPAVAKKQRTRLPGPWRIRDAKDDPALRMVDGEIGLLPFLRAVQEKGIPLKEAYRVTAVMKGLRDLDKCAKTDRFFALMERGSSRLVAFEYVVSPEEVYQARSEGSGPLVAKKLDLAVRREQVRGAIIYDGKSFADSAEQAGFERSIVKTLSTALDGHLSLDELERGDVLRVIGQEVTVLGEFARYAGFEAVEVRFAADVKPLAVYYFHGSKSRGYYDARGRSPYDGGWRKPVKDAPITSHFNPKRLHPILKKVIPHTGTDFGAPAGTPVGAASFGTVSFIGYAGPSGNLVKIDHPGGIETGYAHLSRFAEGLKVGDKVKRLQLVGYIGSTGRSTGPHLHFTAKRNGEFFDAETLNMDGMRTLPGDERAEFEQVKAKYDKELATIPLPAPLPALAAAEPPPEPSEPAVPKAAPDEDPGDELPNAPRVTPPPGPAPAGNGVHLTDKDLARMQPAVDDGEVEE